MEHTVEKKDLLIGGDYESHPSSLLRMAQAGRISPEAYLLAHAMLETIWRNQAAKYLGTQTDLAELLNWDRKRVRKALDLLVAAAVIERPKGRGTAGGIQFLPADQWLETAATDEAKRPNSKNEKGQNAPTDEAKRPNLEGGEKGQNAPTDGAKRPNRRGETPQQKGQNAPSCLCSTRARPSSPLPSSPIVKKKGKSKKAIPKTPTRDELLAAIPKELDTPEFRKAWGDWIDHRQEIKKPLTMRMASVPLTAMAKVGPEWGITKITRAIGAGWVGCLFEQDLEYANNFENHGPATSPGRTQRPASGGNPGGRTFTPRSTVAATAVAGFGD